MIDEHTATPAAKVAWGGGAHYKNDLHIYLELSQDRGGSGVGVISSVKSRTPPHPDPFPREGGRVRKRAFSLRALWMCCYL
ncbi:MAG: hypothetical protein ACT4QC_05185 [Planctomycetaceae bacterium]